MRMDNKFTTIDTWKREWIDCQKSYWEKGRTTFVENEKHGVEKRQIEKLLTQKLIIEKLVLPFQKQKKKVTNKGRSI